ncbi:hypothetical protein GCM10009646_41070 [Streptomyces aureus]
MRRPAKTEEQHTPSPPAGRRAGAEGELHVAEADHAGLVGIISKNTTPSTPAPDKAAVKDLRPGHPAGDGRHGECGKGERRHITLHYRRSVRIPVRVSLHRAAGPRQRTGCAAASHRPRNGSPMVAQHDPIVHCATVSADAAQRGSRSAQSECTATAQPRCAASWVRMIVGAQRRGCAVAVTAHSPAPVRVGFPNAYRPPRPIPRHPASRTARRRAAPAAIR